MKQENFFINLIWHFWPMRMRMLGDLLLVIARLGIVERLFQLNENENVQSELKAVVFG